MSDIQESASADVAEVGRKFAMTKVGKQDYLLPSNNQRTLWRICAYDEEGSEGRIVLRSWQLFRRPMPAQGLISDVRQWGPDWEHWAGPLRTRREAIAEATRSV